MIWIAAVNALTLPAQAQNLFEQLVMPGLLVEGHAKLEKECGNCHEPFSRKSQTRLCLDCHKETAKDRQTGKRFHGRQPDAAKQQCTHCHTDHKGRDADIVQLDRETLNHAFTNFELRDAHKPVPCAGCHASTIKFRETPGRCFDCHKAKDPHKGRLGENCDTCHDEAGWRRVKAFDHTTTRFPLQGAHRAVACSGCHVGERYKGVGTQCADCHRIQDVHTGRYGAKCESCHDENKWSTVHFNHDKATKYPLRGAHARVKCDACHTGDLYHDKLATNCVSCHRKDDRHKGNLGSRCEQCHVETSWRRITSFDHDVTRFPLIGRHAVAPCEGCHRSMLFKGTPLTCNACHRDSHHEGRLGPNCALCHNPNSWTRWRFDHDTMTRYPLTGAHRNLTCEACHVAKNVVKIALPTDCIACHRKDDAHHGSFGPACERCHSTASFKPTGRRP
ncbi:cytochrome c3 family protein [Bradyrhizobium sp.]|uniref:cytochrome c3 family protein n=1 Tax=Bradyrhizobium sp. TaxID=376 RepID=UPI003C71E8B3